MPMMAIALVRCSSRVRSAVSAMTAAEIAPAPWMMRPRITIWMSLRGGGDKASSGEDQQADVNDGLAPPAVGQPAERNLQIACVRP